MDGFDLDYTALCNTDGNLYETTSDMPNETECALRNTARLLRLLWKRLKLISGIPHSLAEGLRANKTAFSC